MTLNTKSIVQGFKCVLKSKFCTTMTMRELRQYLGVVSVNREATKEHLTYTFTAVQSLLATNYNYFLKTE